MVCFMRSWMFAWLVAWLDLLLGVVDCREVDMWSG